MWTVLILKNDKIDLKREDCSQSVEKRIMENLTITLKSDISDLKQKFDENAFLKVIYHILFFMFRFLL